MLTTGADAAGTSRLLRAKTLALLIGALTFAVYFPAASFDFSNYDDPAYVTSNPIVKQGLTVSGIQWAFTSLHAEMSYWHPLAWLSHMLDSELFGVRPSCHHITNIWLHVINAILLFYFLFATTRQLVPSTLVGMVFGVHPVNVESVVWIAERKNLLCTTFSLLALAAYFRFTTARTLAWYLTAFLLFVLAVMSKPMAVTLPLLMLLLDLWPCARYKICEQCEGTDRNQPRAAGLATGRGPSRPGKLSDARLFGGWEPIVEKAPFLLVSGACSVLTYVGQHEIGATWGWETLTLSMRVANAFVSLVRYLSHLLLCGQLALLYPHPLFWPTGLVVRAVSVICLGSYVALRCRADLPEILVGWFWYLISALPVIGLVQVGRQGMADRYSYFPTIGILLILSSCFGRLQRLTKWKWRAVASVSAFALFYLAGLCAAQVRLWSTPLSIWTHTCRVTQPNLDAESLLGRIHYSRGNYEAALLHLKRSFDSEQNDPELALAIGQTLAALNEPRSAKSYLNRAALDRRTFPRAHVGLAKLYARQNDIPRAARNLCVAQEAAPLFREALEGLIDIAIQSPAYAATNSIDVLKVSKRYVTFVDDRSYRAATALAMAYYARGDRPRALIYARGAVQLARLHTDADIIQRCYVRLKDIGFGQPPFKLHPEPPRPAPRPR